MSSRPDSKDIEERLTSKKDIVHLFHFSYHVRFLFHMHIPNYLQCFIHHFVTLEAKDRAGSRCLYKLAQYILGKIKKARILKSDVYIARGTGEDGLKRSFKVESPFRQKTSLALALRH